MFRDNLLLRSARQAANGMPSAGKKKHGAPVKAYFVAFFRQIQPCLHGNFPPGLAIRCARP